MTDQDNLRARNKLRARIAGIVVRLDFEQGRKDGTVATAKDIADAIIDEFELTTETHAATHAKRTMTRITGAWEWDNQ